MISLFVAAVIEILIAHPISKPVKVVDNTVNEIASNIESLEKIITNQTAGAEANIAISAIASQTNLKTRGALPQEMPLIFIFLLLYCLQDLQFLFL